MPTTTELEQIAITRSREQIEQIAAKFLHAQGQLVDQINVDAITNHIIRSLAATLPPASDSPPLAGTPAYRSQQREVIQLDQQSAAALFGASAAAAMQRPEAIGATGSEQSPKIYSGIQEYT